MTRITKQPDQRRNELLKTADKLFSERGFNSVKVSDIVSEMDVAQGTFYYYFKSKEEILSALLEQKWLQIADFIENKISLITDPAARLAAALKLMIIPDDAVKTDPEYRILFSPAVSETLHADYDRSRVESLLPVMRDTVIYGVEKGVFPQFQNTDEVVKILFLGINAYFHQTKPEKMGSSIPPACETLERILGLSAGTLNLK